MCQLLVSCALSNGIMETRILVALGLIAGVVITGLVGGVTVIRRRRRERLRRRGIKTHGH